MPEQLTKAIARYGPNRIKQHLLELSALLNYLSDDQITQERRGDLTDTATWLSDRIPDKPE